MKPAGDHQMEHQPEIVFHPNRDPFSDSFQITDDATFHFANRWFSSAKQKRAGDSNSTQWLTQYSGLQCFEISDNIR
jgi:hypothetical protein